MRITKKQLRDELNQLGKCVTQYMGMTPEQRKAEYVRCFPGNADYVTIVPPTDSDILNTLIQSQIHYVENVFNLDS